MDAKVIDTAGHYITSQGYGRTAILKYRGKMLRVTIKLDAYANQSAAYVSMLDSHGDWSSLISHPAALWHGGAPSYTARDERPEQFTASLMNELVARAQTVVDAIEDE